MIAYFLVGIGAILDWDILLVLGLLIFVLVLRGLSGLASSVGYNFSSWFLTDGSK